MTDEEHKMIAELVKKVDLLDERGKRLESYFMEPRGIKQPTRAEEIDYVLASVRAGKLGVRLFFFLAGIITVSASAWAALKGWKP